MISHLDRTILGAIPHDWDAVPLRDCLDRAASIAGSWGADTGEVSLAVLRSTNLTNDGHLTLSATAQRWFAGVGKRYELRQNDILLERSGGGPDQPVGRVAFLDRPLPGYGFGNFLQRLRLMQGAPLLPKFLFYCLLELHRSGVVERLQHQTTQMRNLDYRDYLKVYLPSPPRPEQEEVVRVLDAADETLQACKRVLGISSSLRRSEMQGPLHRLRTALLQHLLTGVVRATACQGGESATINPTAQWRAPWF
jgi:type I restriction enzyme S subunit